MIKKFVFAAFIFTALFTQAFAVNGQVIVTASGDAIIPAVEGKIAKVQALAILATTTTSETVCVYHGTDSYLLGDATNKLTVDLDMIDGPAGIVLPYNQEGWFQSGTANEAVKMYISSTQPIIVVLTYIYITKVE